MDVWMPGGIVDQRGSRFGNRSAAVTWLAGPGTNRTADRHSEPGDCAAHTLRAADTLSLRAKIHNRA